MRTNRSVAWVFVVLVLCMLAPGAAAGAAERPKISSLAVSPDTARAGESLTFRLGLSTPTKAVRYGTLTLRSPSGRQTATVPLTLDAQGLRAEFRPHAMAEPGAWTAVKAELFGPEFGSAAYALGPELRCPFTILGDQADLDLPKLTSLSWDQETVKAGSPARLTAHVSDERSGVAEVSVVLAPIAEKGATGWEQKLLLTEASPGVWQGTFFAPVMVSSGAVRIMRADVVDRAGNRLILSSLTLPSVGAADLRVTEAAGLSALQTDPFLANVIHVGWYSYLDWNAADIPHLGELWDSLDKQPDYVQGRLNWELMSLLQAVQQLKKEIYVDPVSQFRFVPFHTTGKWMALDKAFQARLKLAEEADSRVRRIGTRGLQRASLLSQAALVGPTEVNFTAPAPEISAEDGPVLMAAVIDAMRRGSFPKDLLTLDHRALAAPVEDDPTLLDRGLVWFKPFLHKSALSEHRSGAQDLSIFLNRAAMVPEVINSVYHDLGHHFADVYLGPAKRETEAPDPWKAYVERRIGNQEQPVTGWPVEVTEGLAADFAHAFMPDDLRPPFARNLLSPLSQSTEALKGFRDWAGAVVATGADPSIRFDREGQVWVGGTEISGLFSPEDGKCKPTDQYLSSLLRSSADPSTGRFRVPVRSAADKVTTVKMLFCTGVVEYNRTIKNLWTCRDIFGREYDCSYYTHYTAVYPPKYYIRTVTFIPAPFAPAQLGPRVTAKPETDVLTNFPRGVTINGRGGPVALQPGENLLQVFVRDASSALFVMNVPVHYEPAGTAALLVRAPATVQAREVTLTGLTSPRALVRAAGSTVAADARGLFELKIKNLAEGANFLDVVATTPAGTVLKEPVTVTVVPAPPPK